MTQITHEQAQSLLQFAADRPLDAAERTILASHLERCEQCNSYANELRALEAGLKAAMEKRWSASTPLPSYEAIVRPGKSSNLQSALPFAVPVTLALVIMLAFYFSQWNIVTGGSTSTPLPTPTAVTAPSPSAQPANTTLTTADECETITYTIQPGDTLESVSQKFGVSIQDIRDANPLSPEGVFTNKVVIPLCHQTPSITPCMILTYTLTPPILTTSNVP